MHRRLALAAFAACLALTPAFAEEARNPFLGGSLSGVFENDKFAFRGEDRHYTNGLMLGWISDPIRDADPLAPVASFARWLPMFAGARDLRFGVSIGQSAFTPENLEATAPILTDRPYAGWLYLGLSLVGEHFDGDAPARLDTLTLNLGVMGPAARAEHTQNRWHSLLGIGEAEGWSNQIPDQPGVMLFYERKWRAAAFPFVDLDPGLGVDALPHLAVSLGNVQTYAAGGATLRFGRNLDVDWGPERILPGTSGTRYVRRGGGFGWYLFAGGEVRAVAYDAFLEGPWFRTSQDVDAQPVVLDLQGGLALTWNGFRMSYSYVVRTRSFEGQSGADRFASINLTASF